MRWNAVNSILSSKWCHPSQLNHFREYRVNSSTATNKLIWEVTKSIARFQFLRWRKLSFDCDFFNRNKGRKWFCWAYRGQTNDIFILMSYHLQNMCNIWRLLSCKFFMFVYLWWQFGFMLLIFSRLSLPFVPLALHACPPFKE